MALSNMEKVRLLTKTAQNLEEAKSVVIQSVNQLKTVKATLTALKVTMEADTSTFNEEDVATVTTGLTWLQNQIATI